MAQNRRSAGTYRAVCAFLFLALAAASAPQAQGQAASAPSPSSAAEMEAARRNFEALPEARRGEIQDALVWTGDYNGAVDGSFGRQTRDAIAAYQRRVKLSPTGILDAKAAAELLSAAAKARSAAGFALVDDARTGLRIGIPEKLLPKRDVNSNGGGRWQSADERITLDTRSLKPGEATLQSLYDRNLAIQTPGRRVTYKLMRPDFFVISGETPTGKFYSRYATENDEIRSFSIGYDKALAADFERIVVAIANSFAPFPASRPTVAAAPMPAAPSDRRLVGNGVALGPGRIATAAGVLSSCREVRVLGRKPSRVLPGAESIAVLEFEPALPLAATSLRASAAAEGTQATVLAFVSEEGTLRLSAMPARIEGGGRLAAALQRGAGGAPIFDRTGALIGLAGPLGDRQGMIAGIVPAMSHPFVDASRLAVPAGSQEPGAPPSRSTGDIVAAMRNAVVAITCEP